MSHSYGHRERSGLEFNLCKHSPLKLINHDLKKKVVVVSSKIKITHFLVVFIIYFKCRVRSFLPIYQKIKATKLFNGKKVDIQKKSAFISND